MRRSVAAIAAGFFYIGILSYGTDALLHASMPGAFDSTGRAGTEMLIAAILYVALFAITGCYLTARLAPDRPMWHALVLGSLGLFVNVAGVIFAWETAPVWFHAQSILMVMPYAYAGGLLREWELARAGAGARAGAVPFR